jgi:hypothetical protein
MKVLIWVGCYFINSTLIGLIGGIAPNSGVLISLKVLLAFASYGFSAWLAVKLCRKWDWHQVEKKAAEAGMTVEEYGTHGLSDKFLAKLEELASTVSYEQVKSELKLCVKSGKITKEQCTFLLKKYCNKR